MGFKGQDQSKSPLTLVVTVITGSFMGMVSSALFNRPIKFFFACVFIGCVVSAVATFLLFQQYIYKQITSSCEKKIVSSVRMLTVTVSTLLTFSFLSVVPLNVDRSFSVWTINHMYNLDKPVDKSELLKEGQNFFAAESGEISRRLEEQVRIGNIGEYGNKVELTSRGKLQAKFHIFIRQLFGLNVKYTRDDE